MYVRTRFEFIRVILSPKEIMTKISNSYTALQYSYILSIYLLFFIIVIVIAI